MAKSKYNLFELIENEGATYENFVEPELKEGIDPKYVTRLLIGSKWNIAAQDIGHRRALLGVGVLFSGTAVTLLGIVREASGGSPAMQIGAAAYYIGAGIALSMVYKSRRATSLAKFCRDEDPSPEEQGDKEVYKRAKKLMYTAALGR
jgi:hypothetical protein